MSSDHIGQNILRLRRAAGLVCRAMLAVRGVDIPLPVFKTDDPVVYIKSETP